MGEASRTMFLGAKVTIDLKSRYWRHNTESNPRGMVGKVVEVTPHQTFFVRWSNGEHNGYRQGDLKVLGTVIKEEN